MIKINDNSLDFNNAIPIKHNYNRSPSLPKTLDNYSRNNVITLSNDTFSLSNNYHKTLQINKKQPTKEHELSDPMMVELELTPNAKIVIKSLLSPVASLSYILQVASIAFNDFVSAFMTFLIFNLLNVFLSGTLRTSEVKLPVLTTCLIGCIFGAKNLVKSTKKIALSIPTGIKICYSNIFIENCSIFDFISGKDRQPKKNFLKRMIKKISS